MSKIKNMTFPICARRKEAREDNLIGSESIEHLRVMRSFSKEDQYLFFYNFQNQRFIDIHCGRKIPKCIKTNKRSPQTTLVLDFDNLVESTQQGLREKFEEFHRFLAGRALFLTSPSGNVHILYVVKGAMPQDDYMRLQSSVVRRFFQNYELFLDKPSSYSVKRGFYHSQHLSRWIESGLVNPTPATQKKKGFFWGSAFELKFSDFYDLLSAGSPTEDRKIHELAEDGMRVLNYMRIIERSGENAEKEKYSQEINRIMASLRRKEVGKLKSRAEEICRRAQEAEYQAAVRCIESVVGEAVFGAEGVREVRTAMVRGSSGRGSSENPERDAQDPYETRNPRLFGDSPEGRRHGSGGSSWDERDFGEGRRVYLCHEPVLDVISCLGDVLKSRGVPNEKLGDFVLKNVLRVNGDRDFVAEESGLSVFMGCLREALDRHPRIRGYLDSSPERFFVWLRHAGSDLRSDPECPESISKLATDAARCFRLYLKTQGINLKLEGKEFARVIDVPEETAEKFVEMVTPHLERLSRGLTRQNQVTARKIFREDREFLISGTRALLTRLKSLYPTIKSGSQIAIGMEDFQTFFQTHTRKAVLLRHIFMNFIALGGSDYVPCIKRKQFLVRVDILNTVFSGVDETPTSEYELVGLLGNGRTWKAICRHVKPMVQMMGVSKTLDIWYRSLDLSIANDKEKRKREIASFVSAIKHDKAK